MEVDDIRTTAEAVKESGIGILAQGVLIALDTVEGKRRELEKAEALLKETTEKYEEGRLQLFINRVAGSNKSWCALHSEDNKQDSIVHQFARFGGLTDSKVETSLVWVRRNCFSEGDYHHRWQEEHIYLVCPECREVILDIAGPNNVLEAVRSVEKRDDGQYWYRNGDSWEKAGPSTMYFLAPLVISSEWEEEFNIPPVIKR